MPARSMGSANTVCAASTETKLFEQTLWATTPVATRIARSGRKVMHNAIGTARISAPAISFRKTTAFPLRAAPVRRFLARLLGPANRRQRHHADTGRRHVVVGHKEIRHQGHRGIDAIALEVAHAAGIKHLVVDAELPG